jgi:hypothetical protein
LIENDRVSLEGNLSDDWTDDEEDEYQRNHQFKCRHCPGTFPTERELEDHAMCHDLER